jgi:hypothetical protein
MRGWHGKRILAVGVQVPVFLGLLVMNRLALLLDHLLFPSFRRQSIIAPVFIVALPRTGTTFLFHTLAAERASFTCFRLWETLFAPAICQKFFFLGLHRLFRFFGSPLRNSFKRLEDYLLADLRRIHPIGLGLPEEGEGLFLWFFSSGWFHHFYPDAHFLDQLLFFDGGNMSAKQKVRVVKRYHACVQRHNYVFNRHGQRRFLAKNPFFMNKLESLHGAFSDGRILTIERKMEHTLASTLSLNAFLYKMGSERPVPEEVRLNSVKLLLFWRTLRDESLRKCFPRTHLRLDFQNLVDRDGTVWRQLADFLQLEVNWPPPPARHHRTGLQYPPLRPAELALLHADRKGDHITYQHLLTTV